MNHHPSIYFFYLKIFFVIIKFFPLFVNSFCNFRFWPPCMACWSLAPRSGIKTMPPALEAWSLNHWTTREVCYLCLNLKKLLTIYLSILTEV